LPEQQYCRNSSIAGTAVLPEQQYCRNSSIAGTAVASAGTAVAKASSFRLAG